MTAEVFKEKHLQKKPLNTLLYIVQNIEFKNVNGFNLHKRAYQTLLELEYLTPEKFWTDLFKNEGEDYAGIVIGGLILQDISRSIDWVIHNGNVDMVVNSFLDYLPWIIENYPIEELKRKLFELSFALKPELREILNQNCLALGLNEVSADAVNDLPLHLIKRTEIERILKTLEIDFHTKASKEELFQELIRQIYFLPAREETVGSLPFFVKVIIRLIKYMQNENLIEANPTAKSAILDLTERYQVNYRNKMDVLGLFKIDEAKHALQYVSNDPDEDFRRFVSNADEHIH